MASPLRLAVWLAVVAASVAVGFYLNAAKTGGVTPAPPTTPANYVFIAGGSDPYWELCVAGAEAEAERLGAHVTIKVPAGEGEAGLKEQAGWLSEVDAEKIDGVAIGPIDPVRETTLLNTLAEKTTVVTVDSDAPASRRMFYVGSSNFEAGEIAAQLTREALPDGGQAIVLLASYAKTNAAERHEGFAEGLASEENEDAKVELVETYLDQGDPEQCRENLRVAMANHPDLGAIVCTFGYHGPIALEELGKLGGDREIKLIAFDEDRRVLDGIRDERVYATIVQDPYMFGAEAIRMLSEVRSGRYLALPVAQRVDVGVHCMPVDKANLADFEARLNQRLGAQEAAAE